MRANRQRSQGIHSVAAMLVFGLLAFGVSRAEAAPFTDHFDELIANLQSRAVTLSNSTDRVEKKQFKAIQKSLKTLEAKSSDSLATDIKNLGKVAKSLAKAFPEDFALAAPSSAKILEATPDSLSTILEAVLQAFIAEVQEFIDTVQATLDALDSSSCKTKAQSTLTIAADLVGQASATTDFATAARLLASGLTSALKAEAKAGNCSAGGDPDPAGDFIKATISGSLNLNFATSETFPIPSATFVQAPGLSVFDLTGVDHSGFYAIVIKVINVAGPGTYPLFDAAVSGPNAGYGFAIGTITFSTFDLAQQKLVGTFSFTAKQSPSGSGSVTVSGGSFSISAIRFL
jgi:hypothetical protein